MRLIFLAGANLATLEGESRCSTHCKCVSMCHTSYCRLSWLWWCRSVIFLWEVQLTLEGGCCCSAQCWHFLCEEDQSWESFSWEGQIWWRLRVGTVAPRIVNDVPYNVCPTSYCRFSWLWWCRSVTFLWQVQYLVTLEDECCCSSHCWRFLCEHETHFSWLVTLEGESCCSTHAKWRFTWFVSHIALWLFEAGAVCSELFNVWRRSIMRGFFCGSHNIWWCWMVTPVALRVVLDVSCETRINNRYLANLESLRLLRTLHWTFHVWASPL